MRPWVNGGWQLAASLQGSSWCMWPPCHSIRKRLDNNHHLPVTCLLEGRIGISLLIMFIKSCVVSLPGRSRTLIRHVICLCHIHYNLISVGESSNFSNGHTRETDMKAIGSSCWKRENTVWQHPTHTEFLKPENTLELKLIPNLMLVLFDPRE